MKKVAYVTLWGAYLFSKLHICDAKIAYLDDIANSEILPYRLHFSKSCHLLKLSKMSMGNIYNWLLQGNGAITRLLACCKLSMSIVSTIFDVSIKEKRVYGSSCFELLPQQMSQSKKVKRSTSTCASMQISTSRSCLRPYLECLMVFRE